MSIKAFEEVMGVLYNMCPICSEKLEWGPVVEGHEWPWLCKGCRIHWASECMTTCKVKPKNKRCHEKSTCPKFKP